MRSSTTAVALLATAGTVLAAVPHEDLALQFAPEFRFTPAEQFFPSSVDYYLPNLKVYTDAGAAVAGQPSPLTVTNVASAAPNSGASTWLTANSTTAAWLKGLNPTTNSVPVYTFIAEKTNGVVDLYYWIFTPYNQGKSIIALGQVGDHVGDWERLSVRTVNGVPQSADYNAHSGGDQAAGTIAWANVPKLSGTNRPIAYVAEGSHGIWPATGSNVYEDILIYQLTDETRDGGPKWDASKNLVPITYVPGGPYSGSLSWLNYKGNWGNKGQTDCWWYFIVQECPLSNGPSGPARDDVLGAAKVASSTSAISRAKSTPELRTKFAPMAGSPSYTLGKPSTKNTSLYTLHVDAPSVDDHVFSHVKIEQECVHVAGKNATLTSTTSTTLLLTGLSLSNVAVPACAAPATVASYTVGLCMSDEASAKVGCAWNADKRLIRAYGENGIVKTGSVVVEDYDTWVWKA